MVPSDRFSPSARRALSLGSSGIGGGSSGGSVGGRARGARRSIVRAAGAVVGGVGSGGRRIGSIGRIGWLARNRRKKRQSAEGEGEGKFGFHNLNWCSVWLSYSNHIAGIVPLDRRAGTAEPKRRAIPRSNEMVGRGANRRSSQLYPSATPSTRIPQRSYTLTTHVLSFPRKVRPPPRLTPPPPLSRPESSTSISLGRFQPWIGGWRGYA